MNTQERERGDLGYGWSVGDKIRPLSETVEYYKKVIGDLETPLEDKKIFENGLKIVTKQLLFWEKEREWCQKPKNKEVAYSLKG